MALYESFDRHDLDAALASRTVPDQRLQRSVLGQLASMVRVGLVGLLLTCWLAGGYAGIVYWALQESLLGVIAASGAAGIGAASTWWLFTRLGSR